MSLSDSTLGCKITIYFGNTRITDESLGTTGDDHIFEFDNFPVSTKNLRLIGNLTSAITVFADVGDGTTRVTTGAAHGFSDNTLVTIAGTTNYNGAWHIVLVGATQFDIRTAFIANDATGTATASEFIVNYDLEPIGGTLTVAAVLPAYTSVDGSYFYYVNTESGSDILTQNFKVEFPRPVAEIDIFNQPHYQEHNNYPHKLSMKIVLTAEAQRNLLTEAMFHSYFFLVIDKNIGSTFGLRAYEGPLWSDEQGSIKKGASYLLPIELNVEQFGSYDATLDEITWGFWEN